MKEVSLTVNKMFSEYFTVLLHVDAVTSTHSLQQLAWMQSCRNVCLSYICQVTVS